MAARDDDVLVRVRKDRSDWRQAIYRLSSIHDLSVNGASWSTLRGLTGRIWCDTPLVEGEVLHLCTGLQKHEIEVVILYADNPDCIDLLVELAAKPE